MARDRLRGIIMRNMILFAGAIIILLACSDAVQAQKFDTLWTQIYWNGYFDSTNCVQETPDHGFILAGTTMEEGQTYSEMSLLKTDSLGNEEWSQLIGGDYSDCAFHVLNTADGGYLVSGHKGNATSAYGKLWIHKLDADGDSVWAYIHEEAHSQMMGSPLYAIETADNGYAITGVINFDYDFKAFILRLSESGDFVDFDTYGGYSYQEGVYIRQLPDNGFMVAGNFNNTYTTDYDFWAFRTDSDGAVIWDSTYAITEYTDLAYGACDDITGIVIVGVARGESWAHKIGFDGHVFWSESISIYATGERVTTITPTADGGYMVGGRLWVTGQRRDFCFTKLNVIGELQWYFTVGGSQDDHGQWITPTADGGFAMVGPSSSFVNGQCNYLVKARSYFCGDANGDDIVNIGDVVALIDFIFRDGLDPVYGYCHGDVNADGLTNIGDAVALIGYIFRGGAPPIDECCQ